MTMASHDEIREALADYAVDALDPETARVVSSHLDGCQTCARELVEIRDALARAAAASAEIPPAGLRSRVLSAATRAPQQKASLAPTIPGTSRVAPRRLRWEWLAVAASIAVAVAAIGYALAIQSQIASLSQMAREASARANDVRQELLRVRRDAARLTRAIDVLRAPDVLRVDLRGQAGAEGATARAYWSRRQGVLFSATGLPRPDSGRVYQLWTITGGAPTSAGVMSIDADGGVTHVAASTSAAPPDAFGVTIEPAGGSQTPTLPIVLLGSTKDGRGGR